MTAPDPQVHVTEYAVSCLPLDHPNSFNFTIKVEWRNVDSWAVCDGFRSCLSARGEWDYEPINSERTDGWLAAHRFDLDDALELAKEQAPLMTVNGWTVDKVLAKGRDR